MDTDTPLYHDQFSDYYRDTNHHDIELRWSTTTASMTEEQFRGGLERLAGLLEREPTPNVLIDVVNFKYQPAPDNGQWREENIIPRYNAAGVKKFAFLLPPEAKTSVENGTAPAVEGSAAFPTGYFNSRERAMSWFNS